MKHRLPTDSDIDYYDALNGSEAPWQASCTDCGTDFSKADHDPTTTCDSCSDQRDSHTSLLEIRLALAKAALVARPVKDVA